jgi:hypothetical protein
VDQGVVDTSSGRASASPEPHASPAAETARAARPDLIQPPPRPAVRRTLGIDLTLIAIALVLVLAATAAAFVTIERSFYSPSAFVERYLDLLAEGDAAGALAVPGVTVASGDLEAAGLPAAAHDALLRDEAMAPLVDAHVVSETLDGDRSRVTVEYKAGAYRGTSTFEVEREGSIGFAPTWRFATSPLAVMQLAVHGSMRFDVNGFEIDKRQVSPDGVDADPQAPVALLVFSPGLYSVSVDTAISATPGVAVLSDAPFHEIPVSIEAEPTDEFIRVIQEKVDGFLTDCATQQVLQPTACPFGFVVQDRIDSLPTWSIVEQPQVAVEPDGAGWRILPTEATAHIDVDIRSLFDGKVRQVSEDVPFIVTGDISVLPDGTVTIIVRGPDTR